MFEALFGPEMPVAARFFLAFLVVLALIGGAAYLVRRFGVDRLGTSTARGRQPRLAVIDATAVDSRRRLVLIRRDNIEHLLLIGGPTDVVVEPNIVRAAPVASTRDAQLATQPARNAPAIEPPPRAAAQHVDNTLWPLQPEPAPRPARAAPAEASTAWPLVAQSEPSPRESSPRMIADPLAGLAMDLSRSIPLDAGSPAERPTPPERPTPAERPAIVERHPPAERPPPVERQATAERQPQDRQQERQQERQKPEPEPMRAVQPQPAAAPELTAADQNLAEMAQRLEAALRRPIAASGGERPVVKPAAKAGPAPEPKNRSDNRSEQPAESRADNRPETRSAAFSAEFTAPTGGREPARPAPPANRSAPPPEPPRPTPPEPKPAAKDAKPAHAKAVYDSLEQEMASLLGRPSEKS